VCHYTKTNENRRNRRDSRRAKTEKEDTILFTFGTDGYTSWVEFSGECIWNDDNEEREWDEETNDYPPLKNFLRQKAGEHIRMLVAFLAIDGYGGIGGPFEEE